MTKTFVLTFFLLFTQQAFAFFSITYLKDGRDAAGILSRELVEISTGGAVSYETSSSGYICPLWAGELKGSISKDELKTLAKEALKVVEEQKKYKVGEKPANLRDISHNLMIRVDSSYHTTRINKNTETWKNWKKKLFDIVGKSLPLKKVSMKSRYDDKQKLLTVDFTHEGTEAMRFFLPETANNAFYTLEGGSFQYKETPSETSVILGPSNKTVTVILDTSANKKKLHELFFSNQSLMHHEAGVKSDDETQPFELQLCSNIEEI